MVLLALAGRDHCGIMSREVKLAETAQLQPPATQGMEYAQGTDAPVAHGQAAQKHRARLVMLSGGLFTIPVTLSASEIRRRAMA
ncbi:hypothetical protein CH75_16865 [Dyella jiangningensis]|nr:hypothetical protein CH75_16865 [Dyella jiangningensis]